MSNQTEFDVTGMTCMGCVRHVTEALKKVEGVQKVEVTLQPGRARVEHDGRGDLVTSVISAIEAEGYEGKLAGT